LHTNYPILPFVVDCRQEEKNSRWSRQGTTAVFETEVEDGIEKVLEKAEKESSGQGEGKNR